MDATQLLSGYFSKIAEGFQQGDPLFKQLETSAEMPGQEAPPPSDIPPDVLQTIQEMQQLQQEAQADPNAPQLPPEEAPADPTATGSAQPLQSMPAPSVQ